jgi:hypothetical protein
MDGDNGGARGDEVYVLVRQANKIHSNPICPAQLAG